MYKIIILIPMFLFTSCAVGSAVSAVSLYSKSAQELTREGEDKLIEKIKTQIEDERREYIWAP